MSLPTQPSSITPPAHLRSVLQAPHGQRFNRSGTATRARGYASSLPQATAPDPARPIHMSPYSRAAYRLEHGEVPLWMRRINDEPRSVPCADSLDAPQPRETSRRAARPPSRTLGGRGSAGQRIRTTSPSWSTRSHRYRRFKRRTLRETAGQTWVFFAAYEAIPYGAAVVLVILLVRSLGILDH